MRSNLIIIGSIFFLFSSCMSEKTVIRKYYTIELPAQDDTPGYDTLYRIHGSCEISQISIDPVYETRQIANRSRSNEITYYMYHQWAVRPAEAVRDMIYEFIAAEGIFGDISMRYTLTVPDYRLETNIRDLEVIETAKSFSAHLNIVFNLVDNKTDSIIITHKADRTEAVGQNSMNLFAAEISKMLYDELKAFGQLLKDRNELFNTD